MAWSLGWLSQIGRYGLRLEQHRQLPWHALCTLSSPEVYKSRGVSPS
jgi:hypothetical protein